MKFFVLIVLSIASTLGSAKTSSELRLEKSNTLEFKAGNVLGGVQGKGFIAGRRFNTDSALELSLVYGEMKINRSDYDFWGEDGLKADLYHLHAIYKTFWSNSFYTAAGLGYRKMDVDAKYEFFNIAIKEQLGSEALEVHFQIGNQWIFDNNMMLGFDWLTFSQPLVSRYFAQTKTKGFDEEAANELYDLGKDLAAKIAEKGYFGAMQLRFGVAF